MQKWLSELDSALLQHNTIFATLPVSRLLQGDGVLAALRQKGFTVVEPDADE